MTRKKKISIVLLLLITQFFLQYLCSVFSSGWDGVGCMAASLIPGIFLAMVTNQLFDIFDFDFFSYMDVFEQLPSGLGLAVLLFNFIALYFLVSVLDALFQFFKRKKMK